MIMLFIKVKLKVEVEIATPDIHLVIEVPGVPNVKTTLSYKLSKVIEKGKSVATTHKYHKG